MPNSASAAKRLKRKIPVLAGKFPRPALWATALGAVAFDQFTKFLIRKLLPFGDSRPLIPEVLHLTHHGNTGAAFGIFDQKTPYLTAISLVFIVTILYYLFRHDRSDAHPAALALILAGAVGNTIDRLRLGYVTDFIDFRVWPIFNVADSAITIGVAIVIWSFIRKRLKT